MKIEFFHDVLCSFCFPMSAVMRKLEGERDDIEIIHRSFALAWDADAYIRSFGSRENVKNEILPHWEHANQLDEEHRFNVEGMRRKDFLFPLSKNPLLAAKAAGLIAGEEGYWDVFDALQRKFFVESENIEEMEVLEEAVTEAGLKLEDWRKAFDSAETEKAVKEDIELAKKYNVPTVPYLVIDGERMVFGFKTLERLNQILDEKKSGVVKPKPFNML